MAEEKKVTAKKSTGVKVVAAAQFKQTRAHILVDKFDGELSIEKIRELKSGAAITITPALREQFKDYFTETD